MSSYHTTAGRQTGVPRRQGWRFSKECARLVVWVEEVLVALSCITGTGKLTGPDLLPGPRGRL